MEDDPVFLYRRLGRGNSNVSHFPALRSKQLVTLSEAWSGLIKLFQIFQWTKQSYTD